MKSKLLSIMLIGFFLLAGCNPAGSTPPTPTPIVTAPLGSIVTQTATPPILPAESLTPIPNLAMTPNPSAAPSVCNDQQVVTLIDSLKTAMLTADGDILGSLVDPNGMEVRYYRNGNVITYTPNQAKFLFETTYEADWGADPASGMETKGSFHDVIVPEMVKIFNQSYTLHCNEIKHGGASYDVTWPYDKDFYSIYYAGTEANGHLDWHTWVVGIDYVDGKPYIYALMQFFWEP